MYALIFIAGLIIGGSVGALGMALAAIGRTADQCERRDDD